MKRNLLKYFTSTLIALLAFPLSALALIGSWSGKLKVSPTQSLKLVLNIDSAKVTLDSPNQGAFGLECQTDFLSSDSISIRLDEIRMKFTGRLIGDSLTGFFNQNGFKLPLTLYPVQIKRNRPQTPQPPIPYSTEDMTIQAPEASLSGTLTLPQNMSKKTPLVVLVSGSGLQNRDEELFEHHPFAVIADYLARNGIASFRYDDRGYGESKGEAENATTADFAQDAEAVVNYLRGTKRFSKVGLIGHSEGGTIGYMLGAKPKMLDFIVSLAGPTIPGTEINAYQNKQALLNSGIDSITAENYSKALLKANEYRANNPAIKEANDSILLDFYPQYRQSLASIQLGKSIAAVLTLEEINPWIAYFLKTDPGEYLKELNIPTFIIYGDKDTQVPASLNAGPAKRFAPKAKLKVYPDLNHLMQHAQTGQVEEYQEIEETISPEVLKDIVEFIKENTR